MFIDLKHRALKVIALLGLFAALAVAEPAHAQNKNYTVNIPFAFYVKDRQLPPGVYTIGPAFQNNWQGLTIRDRDGRVNISINTTDVQSDEHPYQVKLIFNKYGDRYFLSQFFKSRERAGRGFNKSSAERELEERGESPVAVTLGSK
jgi:hypothetical protein